VPGRERIISVEEVFEIKLDHPDYTEQHNSAAGSPGDRCAQPRNLSNPLMSRSADNVTCTLLHEIATQVSAHLGEGGPIGVTVSDGGLSVHDPWAPPLKCLLLFSSPAFSSS
jgi:hypothetical protein